MTQTAALFQNLDADAALAALVGERIYTVNPPPNPTAPYVIINPLPGVIPGTSHGEASGANQRLFQVACFARTFEAAEAVREAVKTALDNVELANGDIADLDDERDDYDDAAKLYRCDADFLL
jgi:hypothetical protein